MASRLLFFFFVFFFSTSSLCIVALFDLAMPSTEEAKVYIVHVDSGVQSSDLLMPILGSEEAVRSSLLYTYTHAMNGFSAKLTPSQATTLAGKPGVLQVLPSQAMQLHGRTSVMRT